MKVVYYVLHFEPDYVVIGPEGNMYMTRMWTAWREDGTGWTQFQTRHVRT